MNRMKYGLVVLLLAVVIDGCKPLKAPEEGAARLLPASYAGTTDTTASATMSWRVFFEDKKLTALIDTALNNNLDLAIALQRVKMAGSDVLLSKGAMAPVVKAMASGGVNRFSDYTMDGAGNIGTRIYDGRFIPKDIPDYLIGLQASWEADVWGRLRNRKRAAAARALASMEGKNVVLTNVITDIAASYYELLALDNQLEIIDETIELQKNALEIVTVQKEAAMANRLGVEQFEAQLISLQAMRYDIQQQITENEARINLLLGRYPQPVERDRKVLAGSLPVRVRSGIPFALLQNRPDIRQAELELAATRADVRAAKADFYPSLVITGNAGMRAFLPQLIFTTPEAFFYSLIAGITAPLINRTALKAEYSRASARQLEALYNYRKVIMSGYTEVYVQMANISNLQKSMELKTKQAALLKQSIETSSELFRTGRSSYLEVLVAQQNALRARLELITTRKEMFRSTISIYKALGGGWR